MASMNSSGIPNLSSSVSKQSFESSEAQASSLSSSVASVVRELASYKDVSALQIVASLLEHHKDDYAEGRAKRLRLTEDASGGDRRPVAEWIDAVRSLYIQKMIPKLHGKLVILGLSMLDWELAKTLAANDFLKTLQEEVYPSFDTLLTSDGNQSWLGMLDHVNPSVQIDTVPTYLDHPTKTDELGRKVFAKILAQRICTMRDEESKAGNKDKSSFMVHIHGPWGSGKSSLLNFLSDELTSKEVSDSWVVINFNAWEHQRLGRPWWWLMNALFKQGVRQLRKISPWRAVGFWLREFWWRSSRTGWPPHLLALLALALLFWIIWLLHFLGISPASPAAGESKSQLQLVAETAQSMSAIIALIITVWGIIFGLSRSLLQGSVHATNTFMESTRDPMKALTRHFNNMVTYIKQPVAIFIDDVDRCQYGYVVELLEGIHTLFSEVQVTYVIAADRRWIYASYEKAYETFANTVEEPGRPLRYLFLEKLFHLSTPVPPLSPGVQKAFWQSLIRMDQSGRQEELEKVRADVKQKLQGLSKEQDILEFVRSSSNQDDPIKEQFAREEAAKRLAAPDVSLHTEHALSKFALLMEPNPRAMKRLVNAYGVQRAIATLVGVNIVMEQLALWTIIVLRWPLLAEYLEKHPEMVEFIGNTLQDDALESEYMRNLFQDEEVCNVIKGKGADTCLDADAIRSCAYLRTSEASLGKRR